jgi:hypothetical protein
MNDEPNYKEMFEKVVIEKEKLLFYIEQLKNEHQTQINQLQDNITSLNLHLKKYTSSESSKKYYEKNKDKIIEKVKQYNKNNKKQIDPDKMKEYNKRAYEKKKLLKQNL